MTAPPQGLAQALRDRYTLERELGRGGMATVFLAQDLRHDRPVALKVLHPELAQALGSERFIREIRLAARLQHPHILPLHDSGEAADLLWYTMPYVRGESLRHRLRREVRMSVDAAVELARQVALALDYAHREGVIHRDLKPENILLSEGQALVADFGVAKALSEAGTGQLTQAGMAIGTPAYMAPEQATGEMVDGRSDLYALGCVLYEMLAGEPPYTGASAQLIMAKRLTDPVPSVRRLREETPDSLDRTIRTALAKAPADRFATGAQLANALAPSALSERSPVAAQPRQSGRRMALRIGLVALVSLVTAAGLLLVNRSRPALVSANERVVMIVPFRVAGADPRLAYLREGMVDLLAAKLTGVGGPRSVDPRTVISAWRRAGGSAQDDLPQESAAAIARRLGAGRLMEGSIVGAPEHVVFTASLLKLSGGAGISSVTLEGPIDSLSTLVDQLTGRLLAREAGEDERLSNLTSTSLPALRAYLEGRSAYRRGLYLEAVQRYQEALALDSTFAVAGIGLQAAAVWTALGNEADRGLALAWAARDRLSKRDRLFLTAAAGPRYPVASPFSEHLSAWERVVEMAPDQPEAQYELADALFHFGRVFEAEDSWDRARGAFRRALALDSTFSSPLSHLIEMAAVDHDTASVRGLSELYLSHYPRSDDADFVRWRTANAIGDSAARVEIRARLNHLSYQQLSDISQIGQYNGIGLNDVWRSLDLKLSKAETKSDRQDALYVLAVTALNRGRPLEAVRLVRQMQGYGAPDHPHFLHQHAVLDALYWGGDTTAAAAAMHILTRSATGTPAQSAAARAIQLQDLCIVELWKLARKEVLAAARAITLLRAGSGAPYAVYHEQLCAALLDLKISGPAGSGRLGSKLEYLDSLTRARPNARWLTPPLVQAANLELARVREAGGDPTEALRVLQRRAYFYWDLDFFSTALRERGRIATLLGDRDQAVRAYQHYLALRSDPEPSQKAEVEQVREDLAKLLAEPSR